MDVYVTCAACGASLDIVATTQEGTTTRVTVDPCPCVDADTERRAREAAWAAREDARRAEQCHQDELRRIEQERATERFEQERREQNEKRRREWRRIAGLPW